MPAIELHASQVLEVIEQVSLRLAVRHEHAVDAMVVRSIVFDSFRRYRQPNRLDAVRGRMERSGGPKQP